LNNIHGKSSQGIILCEGYIDVIALHKEGFTNAAASLGTSFTSQHSSLIKRYTDLVYLCYDSDEAGVKAALRAIPICKEAGLTIKVIDLKPYKDPDDFIKHLSAEEFRNRIEKAKNSFFFEISILEKEYKMEDPEERTKFMSEAARKCLTFENEIERNNYIEAFAHQYQIRSEDFRHLVNRKGAELIGGGYVPKKRQTEDKENRDDGYMKAQKLLLTWLSEDISLFQVLNGIIEETDFIGKPYAKVAGMLFEQYKTEGNVNPAKIVSVFESKEEQSQAAGLFNTGFASVEKPEDKEKALNEVVRHIKKYSLDYQSRTVVEIAELSKIIQKKKKLEKMYISLEDGIK
jgi:DNA primase